MECFYNVGYYSALFLIPVVIYVLLDTNSSKRKGFMYLVKYYYAKKAVKKHQKKYAENVHISKNPTISFPSSKSINSIYLYGVDRNNNSLNLQFILKSNKKAEVTLVLRINGNIYTLPGKENVNIYSTAEDQWKIKDLYIEILEPYKRLRITFNGLLKNIAHNQTEHVQFNFIWACAGTPTHFPTNANTDMLAESVAAAKWRDGSWILFLNDLHIGYDQFGALRGFVRGDRFKDDIVVNLKSSLSRYLEKDRSTLIRKLNIFVIVEDGTLINVGVKSFKNGCSQVKYGSIILNNGDIHTLDDIDVNFEKIGETEVVPNLFSIIVKGSGKSFKCILHLVKQNAVTLINEEIDGSKCISVSAECDVNSHQGNAVIDFWYARKGRGCEPPIPLLQPFKTDKLPNNYVANIDSYEARILEMTGGKGNSLALLTSIDSKNFIVPPGFVITVNAFKKQISTYKELQESITLLENICTGLSEGKLEDACKKTVEVIKNEKIEKSIAKDILKELLGIQQNNKSELDLTRWAVRSSAIGEDSEDLSAAGQNETFLGCTSINEILEAVTACWSSLFTYQSVQYRRQHGLPIASDMAVVVQVMVPAESAGVLFTCHPTTSNPSQTVITSNYGLGESVVSGSSDPDTFVIKKNEENLEIIERTKGTKNKIIKLTSQGTEEVTTDNDLTENWSISDTIVLELVKIGTQLENIFGGPRDVEWAILNNQIYLLQSRPITTSNSWTDFELLHEFDIPVLSDTSIYTVANAAEVFPGAVTVLSQSISLIGSDRGLQKYVLSKNDEFTLKCLTTQQHHVMIDVVNSIHKNVFKEIKLSSKILDLAIFGHPVINDKINQVALNRFGSSTPLSLLKETLRVGNNARKNKQILEKLLKLSEHFNININDNDSLIEMYRKINASLEDFFEINKYHCITSASSVFYQIVAMNLLVERSTELTLEHCMDFALIVSSCEDVVSAEIPTMLENISTVIQESSLAREFGSIDPEHGVEWLEKRCPKATQLLQEFLEKHGHRLLGEFELKEESWGMKPSKVISMLQTHCKSSSKTQKKFIKIEDVLNQITSTKSKITKSILKLIITKLRSGVGIREKSKSEIIRAVNKIRIAYRELANKMVLEGLLPSVDLIFHLSHYEVSEIINRKNNTILINKAMKRQRLFTKWNELKFPEIMYGVPEAETVQTEYNIKESDVVLRGTPVCNGSIKARACVIPSLRDIDQLKEGDILITYSTDIGWSPYFPVLSGIVTELGGLVSHGAVVAREYGLPCIVGVRNATHSFKTGDVVLLSGSTGELSLVQKKD